MPGKYSFAINGGEKFWSGTFNRQCFEAPPGKAARLHGKGDEDSYQFDEKEGAHFIDCLSPTFQPVFKLSRDLVTVPKEKLIVPKADKHKKVITNAPGKDYPEGLPTMDWDRSQLGAFIHEQEPEIESRVRVTTSAETIVLAIWKKHDPARFERYTKDTDIDNMDKKRKV